VRKSKAGACHGRARLGRRAAIDDPADQSRDGRVEARDLLLVSRNFFQALAPVPPSRDRFGTVANPP
jgi:hypothetical protein